MLILHRTSKYGGIYGYFIGTVYIPPSHRTWTNNNQVIKAVSYDESHTGPLCPSSFHIRENPWGRLGEVWALLAQRTRTTQAGRRSRQTSAACRRSNEGPPHQPGHVDWQRPSRQSAPSSYHARVPLTTRLLRDTLGKRHGCGERAASPGPEKVAVISVRLISLQNDSPASNELAAASSDWRGRTYITCMYGELDR